MSESVASIDLDVPGGNSPILRGFTNYFGADGLPCDPQVAHETETVFYGRDGRILRTLTCGVPARARRAERLRLEGAK